MTPAPAPAPDSGRRQFLAALSLAALAPARIAAADPTAEPPSHRLEALLSEHLKKEEFAGAQLAIGKGGKVVWAKGFGFADKEKQTAVAPDALFRIASISKPLTAVAILTFIEEGRLTLETNMLEVLKIEPFIVKDAKPDERVRQITLRHLLNHTAGWDRDAAGDPMFMNAETAKDLGIAMPPGPKDIIRWALGRGLQSDPGARYAYSNLGYCILGRILENLSGKTYQEVIRERVFKPAGITAPKLGATFATLPGEVRYYIGDKEDQKGASVFPDHPGEVPVPYGTWNHESLDAHGGWVACAGDLVKFAMSLSDIGGASPFQKKATWDLLAEPPPGPPGHNDQGEVKDVYYACGFQVHRTKDGPRLTHSGGLPGTTTWLWRRPDGYSFALFFNQRLGINLDGEVNKVLDASPDWS